MRAPSPRRSSAVAVRWSATTLRRSSPAPNSALSLIDFPSLAVYERYREALAADPEHLEVARRAGQAGVILVEDRSFVQRVS
jgi:hypothetical protein